MGKYDVKKMRKDLKAGLHGQDGLTEKHLTMNDTQLISDFRYIYGEEALEAYLISDKISPGKEEHFESFDQMMKTLNGVTCEQAEEMGLDKYGMEIEDDCGYAAFFACYPNQKKMEKILKDHNLKIITLSLADGEEDEEGHLESIYCYSTGWHLVDREKWLLCRSSKEGYCEEGEG